MGALGSCSRPTKMGEALATTIKRRGSVIHVERLRSGLQRLASLILLAPSLYFFTYLFLGLKADLAGQSPWRDDLPGTLVFLGLGLVFGAIGLIPATFRYFLIIDKALGEVAVVRKFGPLKIQNLRKFSEFDWISVTEDWDSDEVKTRSRNYHVNLCGAGKTRPVRVCGFAERQAADDFARELGGALGLKTKDVVDDDPDVE